MLMVPKDGGEGVPIVPHSPPLFKLSKDAEIPEHDGGVSFKL